ncbi:MAG TPA: peptidase M56 BlaR1 [Clostridiales bacterium]|nr:peptidase M56 BlaR1 [Clostridiales bacterium]
MTDSIFYFVLNMSVAACFVIVVLLLIRLIKPLPRRFAYPLWALAFFRLAFPFTLTSGWSFFNLTGGLIKKLITIETITQGTIVVPRPENWAAMNFMGAAETYVPIEYKSESLRNIFVVSSLIWLIVAAAAILVWVILYLLTRSELRKAVRIRDNIFYSDLLLSPVIIGLIRPKIILPAALDVDSPEGIMVLAHEYVHRQRLDNLWRVIAILTACIHWFNPLVWLSLKAFFADMEQSCDEVVLKKGDYNTEERKAYAKTLLHFAEDKRIYLSTAFGQSNVKVRVVNVLNYKRLTILGAILSTLFLLAVILALITNPALRD